MDFSQSSRVASKSKVIWGQVVRLKMLVSSWKVVSSIDQIWFIDKVWDSLYVHLVKGHIRSKVIRGQDVRLSSIGTKLDLLIQCRNLHMLLRSKVTNEGQKSCEVNLYYYLKVCNLTHLHTCNWGPIRTMWPQKVWGQVQMSICIIRKPRRQVTLAVQGPWNIFCLHEAPN